jgi:hypothetical protein
VLGAVVFLVSDLLKPGGGGGWVVSVLQHGEVLHEVIRGGAVPVLFAGWGVDGLPGVDFEETACDVVDFVGAGAFSCSWLAAQSARSRSASAVGVPGSPRRSSRNEGNVPCFEDDAVAAPLADPV